MGKERFKFKEEIHSDHNLWQIDLNPALPEPLVSIFVNKKPIIMLCDSGSEVNSISYRLVQLLQLESEIKETHFRCAGPSGEPLITSGEISLGFTLGSQNYTADFIVVLLAKRTVGR